MSMTDPRPALPKPDRPVRSGLIEDWRDAVWVLLLLLVAAFSGALITRFWPASGDDAATGDLAARVATLEASIAKDGRRDVATLKDRVAKLETRQKSIETALVTPGPAPAATTPATTPVSATPDLRKEIAALTTRIAAAEAKTETLTALDARIAKLEGSDLLDLARRASLATAVANLMRAAQGSAPFKTEYDVVAAMMPGDARLAAIAPIAEKGLPTVGTLIGTFGNIADAARDAEEAAKGKTWWDKLWAHFTSLVSVRSVGETQGASTDARLARGEVRLKAGDLAAAVKELSSIGGVARDALASWLTQAKARVTLEASLAAVNGSAIAALTNDPNAEPVPQLPPP